jgi:hypothetical protein
MSVKVYTDKLKQWICSLDPTYHRIEVILVTTNETRPCLGLKRFFLHFPPIIYRNWIWLLNNPWSQSNTSAIQHNQILANTNETVCCCVTLVWNNDSKDIDQFDKLCVFSCWEELPWSQALLLPQFRTSRPSHSSIRFSRSYFLKPAHCQKHFSLLIYTL